MRSDILGAVNNAIGGALAVALAFAPLPAIASSGPAEVPTAGGMASPDAAVEELLTAARASDPLGVLAVLEPAERSLVKTLYEQGGAAAESTGGVDIDALLLALHIDIDATPLRVEQLADDVAWVTTDSVEVDLDIDMDAADDALAVDLSDTDFDGAGFELTPAFDDLGIAVVREGDAWFVSALYTAAEIGRRSAEQPAAFTAPPTPATPAATPDAAVAALLAAVSAKDLTAAAGTLSSYESALVGDFTGNVGAALLDVVEPYTLSITPGQMQVVEQSDGRAVVEMPQWNLHVEGGEDDRIDTTLDVTGACGDVTTFDEYDSEYEDDSGCLFDDPSILDPLSVLPDMGWGGVRFVAVEEDGGWRVSLLETVLGMLAPTITDAVSAAGLVEVAGYFTDFYYDDYTSFYETVATLVGAGAPVAPPGQSVITPSGNGRIAVFRVDGPATVTVDVAGRDVDDDDDDYSYCTMFTVDGTTEDDFGPDGFGECGDAAEFGSDGGIVIVSEGGVFSSNEPIGTVTATVTPG